MQTPKVSLVASAIRPRVWKKFFDSLKGNTYPYEVVFVGNVKPDFELPSFVNYIYSEVKPSQCYEIGFRQAKGELVGWTADDATYNYQNNTNLDILYDYYKSFKREDIVIGQRPIEDHHDVYRNHYFFGKHPETPYMLPFGFMPKTLFHKLGGYDNRFVAGQAENDMVMRVLEIGGEAHLCMNSFVEVDHTGVHDWHHTIHQGFRHWYPKDREILENAWCVEGYGYFNQTKRVPKISKTRLLPVQSYVDQDILTVSQGEKGNWN